MGGKEKNIFIRIQQGDRDALQLVYRKNRQHFINYARKYHVSHDDILDAYQEAIIAFQENIESGKITRLNSTITTYLFSIGKNKILQKIRSEKKFVKNTDDSGKVKEIKMDVNLEEDRATKQQRLLRKGLKKLSGRCVEILELFYLQGYTSDEIKEILNYSSKAVLKSQKARCIKQLKDYIKKL